MIDITRIACPAPCPITGKPCSTNGAMGHITHYFYPADCPEWNDCEKAAIAADPCPCGEKTDSNCDLECNYIKFNDYE